MKPTMIALSLFSLMSLPVLAENAANSDRQARMESSIAACEIFLAEKGMEITLPRPPQRPTEEQREALALCRENGLLPVPPHGEKGLGGGRGRPMGPPPEDGDSRGVK